MARLAITPHKSPSRRARILLFTDAYTLLDCRELSRGRDAHAAKCIEHNERTSRRQPGFGNVTRDDADERRDRGNRDQIQPRFQFRRTIGAFPAAARQGLCLLYTSDAADEEDS